MIRFGIMGAGNIAAKFCEAVQLVDGVEVAGVASKSWERAKLFAAENGIERAYESYEEMLAQPEIDVVYIATTCNFHYENCLSCIAHKKAILCEKSMVSSLEQAEEIFRRAKQSNVFVMEAMWSRFLPVIQQAKKWIEAGRIGEVQLANYMGGIHAPPEHRIFSHALGGGALLDLTVYPIEIVTYLIPQRLRGVKACLEYGAGGVDVTNSLLLRFEHCHASLQTTAHARIPSPSGFYGTNGYIQMEQTHRAGVCELYDGDFRLVDLFESPVENGFEYEIAHVRDCLLEGKIESDVMPFAATLQCIDIFTQCREKDEAKA